MTLPRGAVPGMLALALLPIAGCLGLAIDFSLVIQARQQMAVAADGAVMSAVNSAARFYRAHDAAYRLHAMANGRQWFGAQLGALRHASITPGWPIVDVEQTGSGFAATVTYRGTVPARLAGIFGLREFSVGGSSSASIQVSPYVNTYLLIDIDVPAPPATAGPRPDAIRAAVSAVVDALQAAAARENQFGIGVYVLNGGPARLYPANGEASPDLAGAVAAVPWRTSPAPANAHPADLAAALLWLSRRISQAGDGSSPSSPRKNLFIVSAGRGGDMAGCGALKQMGVSIYVLNRSARGGCASHLVGAGLPGEMIGELGGLVRAAVSLPASINS